MAGGFQSGKEKSKWDAIQKMGSASIDKMLAGQATQADIKSLASLIAKQSELAAKLFDEGISGAEATADSFIDKLNRDRIEIGKAPLTPKAQERLFKQTFQKVLQAATEDIIGSVHDTLDEKFETQHTETKELINDAFDRVRNMAAPKKEEQQPADDEDHKAPQVWRKRTHDIGEQVEESVEKKVTSPLMAAIDRLQGRMVKSYEAAVAKSPFMAKVDALAGKVANVYDKTVQEAKSTKVFAKVKDFLTSDNPPESIGSDNSILSNLKNFFKKKENLKNSPLKNIQEVMDKHGVRKDKDIIANIEAANKADTTMAKTMPIDQQIATALKSNEELRQKATNEWNKIKGDRDADDEDKKSSTWLRKLKGMFSFDRKGKGKGGSHGIMGILSKLGTVLLVALTSPQLIGTIADGISKYLNFDTISGFIADTWKDIKEGGSTILNWIIDQVKGFFGIGKKTPAANGGGDVSSSVTRAANAAGSTMVKPDTTSDAAKAQIPEVEGQIAELKTRLAAAQKTDAAAKASGKPTPLDVKTTLTYAPQQLIAAQNRLAALKAKVGNATATTSSASPMVAAAMAGTPTGNAASGGAATTSGGGSVSATGPSSTGVESATVLSNSSAAPKTTIVPDSTPTFKDGVAVDKEKPADQNKTAANGGATAGNGVSMGSFGFNSGNDTLNLLNMGAVS